MTRTISQLFDLTRQDRPGHRRLARPGPADGARPGRSRRADHADARARPATWKQAAAELQAAGIDARWIAADCAKEEDIRRLADETLQRMGDVDILVNNAGAAWGAPAEDHPVEAWDKLMNLNVRGYFILSPAHRQAQHDRAQVRAHHQHRLDRRPGRQPAGDDRPLAYNTSKGAVINFTRALGCEWGKYNITVNAICPGFFPSKMTQAHAGAAGRGEARRPRAAAAPGRRRRPEGRHAAVRLGRRQAHHRPVAGGGRRRQRRHRWLSRTSAGRASVASSRSTNTGAA